MWFGEFAPLSTERIRMYIEPQTNIKILHNVPLDTSYDHTIYFTSAITQHGYFAYMTKYDLTNYSYQRVQRGMARVGIKADNLYDCNYMMFQNTAYGNKWFYAFITGVEFVNNETSQITFEIDVMQTWHFDYRPDYCFVEREHSETDNIGDNIVPESLPLGEYIFPDGLSSLEDYTDMSVIIAIIDSNDQTTSTFGARYDGIWSSAEMFAYGVSNVSGINSKISHYLRTPNNIVSMYICPTAFLPPIDPNTNKITSTDLAKRWEASDTPIAVGDYIGKASDLFVPKNNKLYTYPYNFYHVDNANGNGLTLCYEYFGNLTPTFRLSAMITQPVKCVLRPTNYKQAVVDTTESLILSNYPMCSWGIDSYQAWVAQTSVPYVLDTIKYAFNSLGGYSAHASSGDPAELAGAGIQAGISGVNMALDRAKEAYRASIATDITIGGTNNGCINVADKMQCFFGGRCCITTQYARIIDDYFTRFGYATNRLKVPNRNIRPHWNYVKTNGCTLIGSIPADDMKRICSIYDRGITFWKNGSEVGNYTLDNSPL